MIPNIMTFILYMAIVVSTMLLVNKSLKIKKKKYRRILLWGAVIICAIFAAMRGTIGDDTQMYRYVYNYGAAAQNQRRWSDLETGFVIILEIMKAIGIPFEGVLFVFNAVMMSFVFQTILSEKEYINVKLAVFISMLELYFLSWNIMRQCVAVSICLYAICQYSKKRYWNYVILIIIATQIHKSALVCFAVVVVDLILRIDKKRIKIWGLVGILVSMVLVLERNILSQIVYLFTRSSYYSSYITRDAETDGSLLKYYIKLLPVLAVAVLWLIRTRKREETQRYRELCILMLLGYVFSSLGSITGTQVQRGGLYLSCLVSVVIPYCVNMKLPITNKISVSKKNITEIIYIYYTLLFIYNRFIENYAGLVPYSWFR